MVIEDIAGPGTGSYNVSIQRLNSPRGCTSLGIGSAPVTTTMMVPDELNCFRFDGTAGDYLRMHGVTTAGTVHPLLKVFGPDGTQLCAGYEPDANCAITTTGRYTIVADDEQGGPRTGSYTLELQRLNRPSGCKLLSVGGVPQTGSITVPGQIACFRIDAVNDSYILRSVVLSGAIGLEREVITPTGGTKCPPRAGVDLRCSFNSTGRWAVFITDGTGLSTGDFAIAIQDTTHPVGCRTAGSFEQPASGDITAPAQIDCFTYGAGYQQTKYVLAMGTWVEGVRTDGSVACPAAIVGAIPCSAPLLLTGDPYGPVTGPYTMDTTFAPAGANCPPVNSGGSPGGARRLRFGCDRVRHSQWAVYYRHA